MIVPQTTVIDDICPRCHDYGRLIDLVDTRTQSRVATVCEDCIEEDAPPWA